MTIKLWSDWAIGDQIEQSILLDASDLALFAEASGHADPRFMPDYDPDGDGLSEAEAPSLYLLSLFSRVLSESLTGPGTHILDVSARFAGVLHRGEILRIRLSVTQVTADRCLELDFTLAGPQGAIGDGRLTLKAPSRCLPAARPATPRHTPGARFDRLIAASRSSEPVFRMAVVCPEDAASLGGALAAREAGLMQPVLIGHPEKIDNAAKEAGLNLHGIDCLEALDPLEAAKQAVALIRAGEAQGLMKGHLHTDVFLKPVLDKKHGLRTRRRLSHVFVMDAPSLEHLLFLTDAAINIAPDLTAKVDIVQNAIDLARALGITKPKVGILSAIETINPAMASTIDAAILSKMADRGQITGGLVDGPLAMDNAVDPEAARTKGLVSQVAGQADVLVAPNIESGNMMAKELIFVSRAEAAGIVIGAAAPIVLTSRADSVRTRLASCAAAIAFSSWQRTGNALIDWTQTDAE
ncbi:MAG: bifunctional enoyl-CoA hydratase/phosphate acetyltransferase [Asticcacaulis sp.]